MLMLACAAVAQNRPASIQSEQNPASAQQPKTQPVVITLDEAIRRTEKNEPNFANAVAAKKAAALDRSVARAGLGSCSATSA